MKKWNVEIRTHCLICGKKLPNSRFRTYCSAKCRNKRNNKKQSAYNVMWQKAKRDKIANIPSDKKCQCKICGKFYTQVGSHIVQVHKLTARQYREYFQLEVKKGITPHWYRKMKGDQAMENKTYKNLEKGAMYRFKKGQKDVGKYNRSPVTLERLKSLHKFKLNKKTL